MKYTNWNYTTCPFTHDVMTMMEYGDEDSVNDDDSNKNEFYIFNFVFFTRIWVAIRL